MTRSLSLASQKAMIYWAAAFMVVYFLIIRFCLHMLPPPSAKWSTERIQQFYLENGSDVRLGATIGSWVAAGVLPVMIVCVVQMYRHEMSRHEKGQLPIWSILALGGAVLTPIFFVVPLIFFGVAAYTPSRAPEVTSIMHELAILSLMSTDQFFIFLWVPITVVCLLPNSVVHTPFPRWFGYFNAWTFVMLEAGAICFLTKSGPFAWNGLLVFWSPAIVFGIWQLTLSVLLVKAINAQMRDQEAAPAPAAVATTPRQAG